MTHKGLFEQYFKSFVNELRNGNMEKRVALIKSSEKSEDIGMEDEEGQEHLSML